MNVENVFFKKVFFYTGPVTGERKNVNRGST